MVNFPVHDGTDYSPAWARDGNSSPSPPPAAAIRKSGSPLPAASVCAASRPISGPDVSPVFNPKTGDQIAWISGRTGLPQVYIMESDGTNVQRMTDGGYATSPRGHRTASFWHSRGTAIMDPALQAGRTST